MGQSHANCAILIRRYRFTEMPTIAIITKDKSWSAVQTNTRVRELLGCRCWHRASREAKEAEEEKHRDITRSPGQSASPVFTINVSRMTFSPVCQHPWSAWASCPAPSLKPPWPSACLRWPGGRHSTSQPVEGPARRVEERGGVVWRKGEERRGKRRRTEEGRGEEGSGGKSRVEERRGQGRSGEERGDWLSELASTSFKTWLHPNFRHLIRWDECAFSLVYKMWKFETFFIHCCSRRYNYLLFWKSCLLKDSLACHLSAEGFIRV